MWFVSSRAALLVALLALGVARFEIEALVLRGRTGAKVKPGPPWQSSDDRCVGVMRETQYACQGIPDGQSNFDCNYATCTRAESYLNDCADVKTTRKGGVVFKDDLEKLKLARGIVCDDIRHAADDCGKVKK